VNIIPLIGMRAVVIFADQVWGLETVYAFEELPLAVAVLAAAAAAAAAAVVCDGRLAAFGVLEAGVVIDWLWNWAEISNK
jgi:hypothetical protein